MKFEILMSCMHQTDNSLITRTGIIGDATIINQCDKEEYTEYKTAQGLARVFSTTQRGLTKSRNMAVAKSNADICLLCDDDEILTEGYQSKITEAYNTLPQADIIIFKISNRPKSFSDKIQRIRFPKTMKVSSWQISFKRESLIKSGIKFDELLGAGTGNGAEEELKFLIDCQKSGLKIYYVPTEVASVAQTHSTWFNGFDEQFFENRGATTRYILGMFIASVYAFYYVIKKRSMYSSQITSKKALKAIFKGIYENKIAKQTKTPV